jgi:hypothetical protein
LNNKELLNDMAETGSPRLEAEQAQVNRRHAFAWRSWLDPLQRPPRWGLAESVALALWLGLVGFAVAQHDPWADEAQAWMLASAVSWKTLFLHSLHYEGSGGFWHAFLKVLQALHIPFTGMRWLVAGVEGAAIAVLLASAPFPRIVRLLLPFTFFLFYQDAVIARSYCLFAILAFPAAALLRSGRPRPLPLAILLGLMANISVHAALASGGMAIAALLIWRGRLLRSLPAVVLLLLFWAGAIATMIPAADIDYPAGNNIERSIAKIETQVGAHAHMPSLLTRQSMANLPPPPPAPRQTRNGLHKFWNKTARVLSIITYPVSVYRPLALLLVLLVAAQAVLQNRRGRSRFTGEADAGSLGWSGLVPYVLMVLVFTSLYLAPRHVGTVFTGFVITAWLTWPLAVEVQGRRLVLERITAGLMVLMCLVQISWSFHALHEEQKLPYAPGKMTAAYLKSRGVGAPGSDIKVAGFYYFSIDPLLYFDHNIYFNEPPHRYWFWSTAMRTYGTVEQALSQHPSFIVIGGFESGHDAEITRDWLPNDPPMPGIVLNDAFHITQFFENNGYHPTHVFCGHSWMRSTYAEQLCDTVLEPVQDANAANPH